MAIVILRVMAVACTDMIWSVSNVDIIISIIAINTIVTTINIIITSMETVDSLCTYLAGPAEPA